MDERLAIRIGFLGRQGHVDELVAQEVGFRDGLDGHEPVAVFRFQIRLQP
jgi:hypothetical protein